MFSNVQLAMTQQVDMSCGPWSCCQPHLFVHPYGSTIKRYVQQASRTHATAPWRQPRQFRRFNEWQRTPPSSFISSFLRSIIHSFNHSTTHSRIYLLAHSAAHSFTHASSHSFKHLKHRVDSCWSLPMVIRLSLSRKRAKTVSVLTSYEIAIEKHRHAHHCRNH